MSEPNAGAGTCRLDVRGDDGLGLSGPRFVPVSQDVLRVVLAVVRAFEPGHQGLDVICTGREPKGGDTERIADFWDCRQLQGRIVLANYARAERHPTASAERE